MTQHPRIGQTYGAWRIASLHEVDTLFAWAWIVHRDGTQARISLSGLPGLAFQPWPPR